ncbi:hypothetical protein [Streptomyces sp. NBC_01180]|uniref:hypothetical protein n=1 Tax=Streptomyces sp. NBC_01180 TaxID=2903763 RepID=UPI00386D7D17|nr:hypothetical protein OG708_19875 [Streptomyces sp. NBC_01180]
MSWINRAELAAANWDATDSLDQQTAQPTTDVGLMVVRLASEKWATDERTDFAQTLEAGTTDLLTITAGVGPSRPVEPRAQDQDQDQDWTQGQDAGA